MHKPLYMLLASLALSCCGQKNASRKAAAAPAEAGAKTVQAPAPVFDADSAYSYVAAQVAFGPRVPNTDAQKACADYLASELERHGAKLYTQEASVVAYNGDHLRAINIIGAFNPENTRRVMLFAHWDSRPYSDRDPDEANLRKAIDGADDGASGVGVLLEIARQIGMWQPAIGVDIIFFDAEDYGTPDFINEYKQDTWCLGAQYWAKHPHVADYKAEFGILLDMVGARGATFYKEYTSVQYAAQYVDLVWSEARDLGYGKYFINRRGGAIIDDHQYVISGRRIPCLDIVYTDPDTDSGFGAHWHTQNDNMGVIDKETLKAAGQTVLAVVYKQ